MLNSKLTTTDLTGISETGLLDVTINISADFWKHDDVYKIKRSDSRFTINPVLPIRVRELFQFISENHLGIKLELLPIHLVQPS
ncbi:hypothetical protein [Streptococcus pluranimalium]|uniref:hypothetical protein n=1 Tax=Streptococcus pluranimalium TaxID=82348 RepID=UPI00292EB09E|nr:hypothetical protein [Streptococcus pluranimalium]